LVSRVALFVAEIARGKGTGKDACRHGFDSYTSAPRMGKKTYYTGVKQAYNSGSQAPLCTAPKAL
jgi:hypothetical protein